MKKIIFKYEGEEKEITLSSINEIKSIKSMKNIKGEKISNPQDNNSDKSKKTPKVKFSNIDIPFFSMMNIPKKRLSDNEDKKEDNPHEIFERRRKKFHTLMTKKSKIFETNTKKQKRRKKVKGKTVKLRENISKKEEEDIDKEKDIQSVNISNQIDEKEDEKEEFEDKEMQTKLEIVLEKKFTPTQTMLSYCKCQLYISYDNMMGFQYTGLEGILCVMINRLLSNLYLQVYDILDFKKQFEIELYTNILLNKGYEVMSDKFHTIEFPTFCLGINFYTIKKAEEIKNIILNYSKALNSTLFYQYDKKNHDTFKQKKLFDFIVDPKKAMNYNDKKKKTNKEVNNNNLQNIEYNNLNNENDSNYLETIFGNLNKKINYKISSNEQMLSFSIDKEANEVTFDTSKGANRFLEQNNIEISDINEEYENLKEKVKSKLKNNKFITNKTKKSIQEDIKDKENKEKIMEILNQIEGLQVNDKINLEIEKDKEKFNNKIKKFNVTKRLPLNQKMQINSAPDNLIFYGGDSDSLGDGEDNFEEEDEGDEEEEDDQDEENKEEENDIIKDLLKQNEINNNLNTGNNRSEDNSNNDKNSIKIQLSGIVKKLSNSSEISSKTAKNENNNDDDKKKSVIEFSSKQSSIKKSEKSNSNNQNINSHKSSSKISSKSGNQSNKSDFINNSKSRSRHKSQ